METLYREKTSRDVDKLAIASRAKPRSITLPPAAKIVDVTKGTFESDGVLYAFERLD